MNDRADSTKDDDKDAFWDIDFMLPPKKIGRSFSTDTSAVTVSVETENEVKTEKIPPRSAETEARLAAARRALSEANRKLSDRAARACGDSGNRRSFEPDSRRSVDTESLYSGAQNGGHISDYRAPSSVPSEASSVRRSDSNYTALSDRDEALSEYSPEGNPLIQKVTVRRWPSRYTFYERFRADAEKYYSRTGTPCSSEPYFSFMPQYVQLSPAQLKWYFYWRTRARAGEYLATDYSYILLYLYELINLPLKEPPERTADAIFRLWQAYRNTYPKLDRSVPGWLADYCLINNIAPPDGMYCTPIISSVVYYPLREFYIGFSAYPYAAAMLRTCSGYDWRRSKYITPENEAEFEAHIERSFVYAFQKAGGLPAEKRLSAGAFYNFGLPLAYRQHLTLDSFSGALCAYDIKRRIDIDYITFSRSAELRMTVTDALKYAENNVRALLGIKNRFHTPGLPAAVKAALDEYFAPYREKAASRKAKEAEPEYERLYDAPSTGFSAAEAERIERSSWEAASKLTEAFADEDEKTNINQSPAEYSGAPALGADAGTENGAPALGADSGTESGAPAECADAGTASGARENNSCREMSDGAQLFTAPPGQARPDCPVSASQCAQNGAGLTSRDLILRRVILLMDSGDSAGLEKLAREINILPETLAEELNERSFDIVGDIACTYDGTRWTLVPDYREELLDWTNK